MIARFGPFTLDAPRRHLLREGSALHLTPKAFDLMVVLVTEAPRVVSKRELHDRLWPGTFVSDATLVGLIKELRKALHDRDQDAPVIRTAHRIGYALSLDVEMGPAPPMSSHWLVVRGRPIGLRDGENTIGRDPASHIWLDASGVSRHHARMVVAAGTVRVEDCGSKNGTTVRGQPVAGGVAIADGDEVAFGSTVCVYRASIAGVTTKTRA